MGARASPARAAPPSRARFKTTRPIDDARMATSGERKRRYGGHSENTGGPDEGRGGKEDRRPGRAPGIPLGTRFKLGASRRFTGVRPPWSKSPSRRDVGGEGGRVVG